MSWLEKCYSRMLIDNHITDLNPRFMSRFAPAEYVRMLKLSGVESSMVYACDHNGNSYYPTKVGHMHAGLNGRDIFGETVRGLADAGIIPVAYHTIIHHNWSAKTHPQWQMRDRTGNNHGNRYYWSCPNNDEYVEFCYREISEILAYPVAGIFIDMTFWPTVCCCNSCRAKFRAATGAEIPEVIDWRDPAWVRFQRWREDSMAEYAMKLTGHARKARPGVTVTHQFSPVLHGWFLGASSGIAEASDYTSGDFYGGRLQQRFGAKAFSAYTNMQPYEFMTSRCVSLHDHTSTKSDEELYLHAATTLANGGAYFFIDAINPDGTLNEHFYKRLGKIVRKLEPFRRAAARLRPVLRAEVGLYYSMSSCVDESKNRLPLLELFEQGANMDIRHNAVLDEVLGTAALLNRLHVPYKVITDRTSNYSGFKAIIVNHAAYLSPEEAERLRRFVAAGGTLIATGKTSLYDRFGNTDGDFQLADVFGVSYTGKDTDKVCYLAAGDELISCSGTCYPLVEAHDGTRVDGTVTLPDFPVNDPELYASIHSNPPGVATAYAGLTEHIYGSGRCVYLYSGLLAERQYAQQSFGETLFRRHLPMFVTASRNLPASVELTLLECAAPGTLLLGMVDYQEELPNITLADVELTVKLPEGFTPKRVRRTSDGKTVPFRFTGGELALTFDRFRDAELFELTMEE